MICVRHVIMSDGGAGLLYYSDSNRLVVDDATGDISSDVLYPDDGIAHSVSEYVVSEMADTHDGTVSDSDVVSGS